MQLLLSTGCLSLTLAVVLNAYYLKKQFYPAVVYITKSNASMAVIYLQFFVIVFMFGKLLRRIFLGTLRAAEFEHLLERFWYAITETCLAFTVFRDDFNPRFVALFTVLLFIKSFHWLAEERVNVMERSPVLGWLFHLRVVSLLAVLGVLDYMLLMHAYDLTLEKGPTVQLVFGFEYGILLTMVASISIKYILHSTEMRTDTPWEHKAVFLLYTELVIGLIKVILYLFFVIIMVKIYALPMFIFRPMFFTIRKFKKALSDVIMSRRAIRNMNNLYPDATDEELRLTDNICIICREDMVNHSKKLPCGHIFHTTCLRSWFQRQQTCPTCRLDILRTPTVNLTAYANEAADPAAAAAAAGGAAAGAGVEAAAGENDPNNAAAANGGDGGGAGIANLSGAQGVNENGMANAASAATPMQFLTNAGLVLATNMSPVANGLEADEGLDSNGNPNVQINDNGNEASAGSYNFMTFPNIPTIEQIQRNYSMLMPGSELMGPLAGSHPFFTPYVVPPPPMPDDLTNYTDEELRAMEGNERRNIEERLKLLRRIDLMLNATSVLMNNYQMVAPALSNSVQAFAKTNAAAAAAKTITNGGPLPAAFSMGNSSSSSTSNEVPTTSSAALIQLNNENAMKAFAATSKANGSMRAAAVGGTTANAGTLENTLNKVTLEDVPADDEEISISSSLSSSPSKATDDGGCSTSSSIGSTASSSSTSNSDQEEANKLNELRRRRNKFFEDFNKNKTTS